jgi:hypothetical protein
MKTVLWWGGKGLQAIALLQVGWALWMGVATQDARLELQFLLVGAAVFGLGLFMTKAAGGGGSST